jgi:hypothetical protein
MTSTEEVNVVNNLLKYLTETGSNNVVGQRFDGDRSVVSGGNGATLSDAIFVKRVRDLVNELTPEQRGELDPELIDRLEMIEPVAIDIRIRYLNDADKLGIKDYDTVKEIYDIYQALTDSQKGKVKDADKLLQYMDRLNKYKAKI